MIRFFRNIRQKLAAENKVMQYLRYAIGEILLVVIGILIALQVNNWNEGRKDKLEVEKVLENLESEFQENLRNLNDVILKLDTVILANKKIFDLFNQQNEKYSGSQIDSLLYPALLSPNWRPTDYVLNDLKNSGRLSKLSNLMLKRLLFNWSRFIGELNEVQEKVETTNNSLIEFIKTNGSLRNIDRFLNYIENKKSVLSNGNLKLLSDYRFENMVDDKLYNLRAVHKKLTLASKLIDEILLESRKNKSIN